MTDSSSLGGMDVAPALRTAGDGSARALWERIAAGRPGFGRPSVFCGHIDRSKWLSFTVTLRDPMLFRFVLDLLIMCPAKAA